MVRVHITAVGRVAPEHTPCRGLLAAIDRESTQITASQDRLRTRSL